MLKKNPSSVQDKFIKIKTIKTILQVKTAIVKEQIGILKI